jgi:hypothetical protein
VTRGRSEHKGEGNKEKLITEIVANVQDPITPILETTRFSKRSNDAGRVVTRLGEVVDHRAAVIDENLLGVRAVEIHLGHVSSSFAWRAP